MDHLLSQYGYPGILIGTILEGGTLLSLGGFAAHQGYLKLVPWVVLVGTLGSFIDAQIWYCLGRWHSTVILARHPKWKARLTRVDRWLRQYHLLFILFSRFIPGFRTVGALAIGISGVGLWRFTILNVIGAFLWATAVSVVGYLFGQVLAAIAGDLKQYEIPLLVSLAIAALLFGIFFRQIQARKDKQKISK